MPYLGNYKSQQAPQPKCFAFPGLLEQSLSGDVVLAAQAISTNSLVWVIQTPAREMARAGVEVEGGWG